MIKTYDRKTFWDTVNSWCSKGRYLEDVLKLRGGDSHFTMAEFLVEDKLVKIVLEEKDRYVRNHPNH